MAKKRTSKKRGLSLKDMPVVKLTNTAGIKPAQPEKYLMDKKAVAQALWQSLVDNDPETFKEVLRAHLEVMNKNKLTSQTEIARRTLFRMLSPGGNPTLTNISKIIHQLCA